MILNDTMMSRKWGRCICMALRHKVEPQETKEKGQKRKIGVEHILVRLLVGIVGCRVLLRGQRGGAVLRWPWRVSPGL